MTATVTNIEIQRYMRMCFKEVTQQDRIDTRSRYYRPIRAMALYYVESIATEGAFNPNGGAAYQERWAQDLLRIGYACWQRWYVEATARHSQLAHS